MTSGIVRLIVACLALLAASDGSAGTPPERGAPVGRDADRPASSRRATRDAAAVEKAIQGLARALSAFPRTLDTDSVLDFYAPDFTGVDNGEDVSVRDEEDFLLDLADQVRQGNTVRVLCTASNVEVHVASTVAFATYDYLLRFGLGDEVLDESDGRCTSIYQKTGNAWKLRHEHCSSLCPECEDEEGDEFLEGPTKDRT